MGTLVIYTAVGTQTVALAQAPSQASADTQGQSLSVRRFDIPAGALDGALAAFQEATHFQLKLGNEVIRNINSPGVSGLYPPEQALRLLLAGTESAIDSPAATRLALNCMAGKPPS